MNTQSETVIQGKRTSLLGKTIRRLFRSKTAIAGLFIIIIIVGCAVFAPFIAPCDPLKMDLIHRLDGPSASHFFGLDKYGRDIFSRVIYGSRVSLMVGATSVLLAGMVGVIIGVISGYFGGSIDFIIMRIIDIMLCFPTILLALAIMAVLGTSLMNVILAIGAVSIPTFARLIRGSVLSVKEMDYIEAARASGSGSLRIIFRHVVPNSFASVVIYGTMRIATAILSAAGLSFLGMGIQPPTPEWGSMVADGRAFMLVAPHITTFPGLAIMFTVMGFNLLGDGLRDALDPKLWM